jgi:hypothetical protein
MISATAGLFVINQPPKTGWSARSLALVLFIGIRAL